MCRLHRVYCMRFSLSQRVALGFMVARGRAARPRGRGAQAPAGRHPSSPARPARAASSSTCARPTRTRPPALFGPSTTPVCPPRRARSCGRGWPRRGSPPASRESAHTWPPLGGSWQGVLLAGVYSSWPRWRGSCGGTCAAYQPGEERGRFRRGGVISGLPIDERGQGPGTGGPVRVAGWPALRRAPGAAASAPPPPPITISPPPDFSLLSPTSSLP